MPCYATYRLPSPRLVSHLREVTVVDLVDQRHVDRIVHLDPYVVLDRIFGTSGFLDAFKQGFILERVMAALLSARQHTHTHTHTHTHIYTHIYI